MTEFLLKVKKVNSRGEIIDTADLPTPAGYSFSESDLIENMDRNAAGYANWDIVRTGVGQLDITWNNISADDIKKICNIIRGSERLLIQFLDTNLGEIVNEDGTPEDKLRYFYAGNRASQLVKYISSSKYWSTITVPFLEV